MKYGRHSTEIIAAINDFQESQETCGHVGGTVLTNEAYMRNRLLNTTNMASMT